MFWSFALVNNKLSEVFFERKKGKVEILGHCYVKESEYKTEKEKKWIKKDVAHSRFIYRDNEYKSIHRDSP